MNQISQALHSAGAVHPPRLRPPRVAIVASGWHADIVSNAIDGIRNEFARAGLPAEALRVFQVPGAFEIPLHVKRLAGSGRFDAIIACGLVVNGGIYRHEFVASAVIDGLMRVQIETDTPVFSAVLTPRDFHEHAEHQAFFREHFTKKGIEVGSACLATLASLDSLPFAVA
ncbi:MAG: 6,7-dimethyl-8-ribityllumazine synthase [Burkholderiaceae bacterium]